MSLEEQLIQAIRDKNVEGVRSLLEQGANASAKDDTSHKASALILATENNDKNIVQLLLSHGTDVNAKTNDGMSSIFIAVTKNKDIVKLLLDYGAGANDKFIDFEGSNDGTLVRTYTPITFMLMGELNENDKRDKIDILKLLLQAGANPDTTCRYEDANGIILVSILFNANPEILFLLLIFGAELKNEDLAIIREKSDLRSCFTAFETVKVMPNLGKLIEANIKKENAEAIAEYINNEAKKQELIKEFGAIKEGYGSDKQLSFVLKYLLNFIENLSNLSEHKKDAFKTGAFAGIIEAAVLEKQSKDISLMNDLEIKDYEISDKDTSNLRLACKRANDDASACYKKYEVKAESLLTQLEEIDPSAKRQCNL